ncbi:MAG: FimB/Mfa2 family fimbrial subunit [Bacteroides sp.]|nr:FimB/Mfa2 family fimbrial subunit [Bacteroides sp.]
MMKHISDRKGDVGTNGSKYVPGSGPSGCLRSVRSLFSRFLVLSLFVSCLCSCLTDDNSDCPDEETTLTVLFEYYPAGSETDLFADYIEYVELYLYDENQNHYATYVTDAQSLATRHGVTLQVDPGAYYLTAWANATRGRVECDGETIRSNYFLVHNPEAATTGELFYAPDLRSTQSGAEPSTDFSGYRITVAENENNVHILPFMGAYHTVEVYISGLEDNGLVAASVEELYRGYDFYLNTLTDETIGFTRGMEPKEVKNEGTLLFASFHIPHFDDDHSVTVCVSYGDAEGRESVVLQDYIRRNDIPVNDGDPQVIPILFEYRDGTFVQVSFPGWMSNEVETGF